MSDFSTVPSEVKALDDSYVLGTYGRLPVEFVKGSGAVLTDSEGNDYLDFLGGIGRGGVRADQAAGVHRIFRILAHSGHSFTHAKARAVQF